MPFMTVFPAPPPTSNDLTSMQRAQLVRKAKKIEQLLGATPHLLDITTTHAPESGPIHISLPYNRASFSGRRSSIDSSVSRSSSVSLKRSISAASSSSRSKLTLKPSTSKTSLNVFENDVAPVLHLAMDSLTLNPANRASVAGSVYSCESPSESDYSCDSPCDSFAPDANFVIPTPNSLRKQKMDRLRKKLGGDVPYHLVFPNEPGSEDTPPRPSPPPRTVIARVITPQPVQPNRALNAPLPPLPAARPRKHTGPRIAHARDSIGDAASSIHRARRQVAVHPRPVARKQESHTSLARGKNRLSFIIENPDENTAGLLNEYGLHVTRVSVSEGADVITEWFGANVNLWTGQKPQDSAPKNKRRPSSYRKPPPPLPTEILLPRTN